MALSTVDLPQPDGSQQADKLAAGDLERDTISRNVLPFRGVENDGDVIDVNRDIVRAKPALGRVTVEAALSSRRTCSRFVISTTQTFAQGSRRRDRQ